jgi:large subunit ribosomal protein L22
MYKSLLKNALISELKVRQIVKDLKLKGLPAQEAMTKLSFVPKKGAKILLQVLNSAVSNAEHNGSADIDDLLISSIQVDKGLRLKRIRPRAKGRAYQILKRRCHIHIELTASSDAELN